MRLTLWFLLGGLCVFVLFHASYCRIIIEIDQRSRSQGQRLYCRDQCRINGREVTNILGKPRPTLPPPLGVKPRNP
ncbi:hypothetical protein I3843_16G096300 [Carya illinoinensis]|nr:hypothetical protein I3843_16G096300 [Carya illinoinensis]